MSSTMFMQSFENSNKQQARRQARMEAMKRMEEAANLAENDSVSSGSVKPDKVTAIESSVTVSVAGGSNKKDDGSLAPIIESDNNNNNNNKPRVKKDRPWNTPTADADASSSDNDDSFTDRSTSALSVAHSVTLSSASKFLAETQKQHELEHPAPPSPTNSLQPSLGGQSHLNLRNKLGSANARQFLWDDQSVSSAYTQRSATVNLHDVKGSFSNAAASVGGGSVSSRSVNISKGHNGRGARWSAINTRSKELGEELFKKMPLWGVAPKGEYTSVASSPGGIPSSPGGGKYQDEENNYEGKGLLDLASKSLSLHDHPPIIGQTEKHSNMTSNSMIENNIIDHMMSAKEEAAEYGELIEVDDSDDDSFMQEEQESEERRQVFLDRDGNLSYDKARVFSFGNGTTNTNGGNGNSGNEHTDLHSRRMMNSYKRALKKPVFVLCAIAAGIGMLALAGTLYSKMLSSLGKDIITDDISGGDGNGNGNGNHQVESYQNDWADVTALEETTNSGDNWVDQGVDTIDNIDAGNPFQQIGSSAEPNKEKEEEQLLPYDKPRFDHIRYTLVDRGASPPEVFSDTHSAQYAALVWLTRDDPRRMDPDSVYLVQRYGLAVLWFGTTKSGYEWHVPEPEGYAHDGEDGEGGDDEDYDDQYEQVYAYEDEDDDDKNEQVYDDQYEDAYGNEHEEEERIQNNNNRKGRRKLKEHDPNSWFEHDKWLTSAGICGWHGVRCHPHVDGGDTHDEHNDGDVSRIELRRNNLNGLIPDELYSTLPYLQVLDLSDNGFAGTFELSNDDVGEDYWENIETLNLTSNNIAGSLTSNIGKLTSLKVFHVANNLLEGSIPHSVGGMTSLRHLDLSGNALRGTIPFEMGNMKELSSLNLSWNLLAGPLPHEFSELQTLVSLDVGHNNLGGPLLMELSKVTYLTVLRLNDNHFNGELPSEIGDLAHLDELLLNNNDFRGTLPTEISKLDGLDSLNIANNHFEGEFPPEWTEMAGLQELDISSNELKGEIPIFIDGMKNLRSLNMAHNDFSSSIPSELGSLYKLEYLYLDDNEFVSNVPEELGELTNLKKMALHNNFLSGDVDQRICKLADELFLTQLSADCAGEMPTIYCDCCICHDHEPIVHLNTEP